MDLLTRRQKQIFKYIEKNLDQGISPSQRDVAKHFDISQNAVFQIITYLKLKGYLISRPGHRGLSLAPQYAEKCRKKNAIAIIGHVAAGEPILADQNIEGYFDVEKAFGKWPEVFLLRVRGQSMINAGIFDGDLVAVNRVVEVNNGDIAVVRVEDESTVKRVYFKKDCLILEPANKSGLYDTRYLKQNDIFSIIGKVVGSIRTNIGG
jgi:repressor LexA